MEVPKELKARMDDIQKRMDANQREAREILDAATAVKDEVMAWAKVHSPSEYLVLSIIHDKVFGDKAGSEESKVVKATEKVGKA